MYVPSWPGWSARGGGGGGHKAHGQPMSLMIIIQVGRPCYNSVTIQLKCW